MVFYYSILKCLDWEVLKTKQIEQKSPLTRYVEGLTEPTKELEMAKPGQF